MAGAGIDLLDLDAVQLQSMPFQVRRVVVRLDACTIVHHSTNARMCTRTSVLEGRLGVGLGTAAVDVPRLWREYMRR